MLKLLMPIPDLFHPVVKGSPSEADGGPRCERRDLPCRTFPFKPHAFYILNIQGRRFFFGFLVVGFLVSFPVVSAGPSSMAAGLALAWLLTR